MWKRRKRIKKNGIETERNRLNAFFVDFHEWISHFSWILNIFQPTRPLKFEIKERLQTPQQQQTDMRLFWSWLQSSKLNTHHLKIWLSVSIHMQLETSRSAHQRVSWKVLKIGKSMKRWEFDIFLNFLFFILNFFFALLLITFSIAQHLKSSH